LVVNGGASLALKAPLTGIKIVMAREAAMLGPPAGHCRSAPAPPFPSALARGAIDAWPQRTFLELGALPTAVPCARLHTREVLWEWRLTGLSDSAELVVSELVTNAVAASACLARISPVRLWLVAGTGQVMALVWDASPWPPAPADTAGDAETGRGLLLVEAMSERWDWYAAERTGGKVVWALLACPRAYW
jgi:anti-sigma regulatory factor (Ser/Thr protein kinase)